MSDPNLEAKSVQIKSLPMIDVSGLLSSERVDRQVIGNALHDACLDTGFFYITGHGVSSKLQNSVFKYTQEFFALPIDEKEKINQKARKRVLALVECMLISNLLQIL